MSSRPDLSQRPVHSYGGVTGRKLEVLLVHRPSYDDWSIPKGKLNNGEDIPVAAIREVEEETGVPIYLGQPLGKVNYRLGDGRKKTTYYWAARPLSTSTKVFKVRPHVSPAKSSEVDKVRWVTAKKAFNILTQDSDKELLGKLVDQHNDDKLDTWTLHGCPAQPSREEVRLEGRQGFGGDAPAHSRRWENGEGNDPASVVSTASPGLLLPRGSDAWRR